MTDLLQKLGEAAGRSSPGAYGRWGAWFSGSLALVGTGLSALVGGWDGPIKALLFFMAFDFLSGFAAAILLERGGMATADLTREVSRRLSPGTPAELGAGWFQGLAMRNRYALIARLSLWQSLSDYLDGLDEEEFKRALVFLRRAFADFTAREKDSIGENLGELWGLNRQQVSETVNAGLTGEDQQLLAGLDDFDFDL